MDILLLAAASGLPLLAWMGLAGGALGAVLHVTLPPPHASLEEALIAAALPL